MTLQLPSWARRGEQCICIQDDWETPIAVPVRVPMLREILTIDEVIIVEARSRHFGCLFGPGIFLAFEEIPLFQTTPEIEANVWWKVEFFQPLIRIRKTQAEDVALFEQFATRVRA